LPPFATICHHLPPFVTIHHHHLPLATICHHLTPHRLPPACSLHGTGQMGELYRYPNAHPHVGSSQVRRVVGSVSSARHVVGSVRSARHVVGHVRSARHVVSSARHVVVNVVCCIATSPPSPLRTYPSSLSASPLLSYPSLSPFSPSQLLSYPALP
jgi:hypothetical protein